MKFKYLWLTDLHLDKLFPWKKYSFIKSLQKEAPEGIIITGDISNGRNTCDDLEMMAKAVHCPIYFILGNHDYHWSSLEGTHCKIRDLCSKYPNLIWITEAGIVPINDEVAFIGTEGWYNAEQGKPEYLKFTLDWLLIEDFRKLPNMNERIKAWRKIAEQSSKKIESLLEEAIELKYKTIYVLTHFPPWKEATRDVGTFMEKFWLPYNTNLHLGRGIEKVMAKHKKHYVHVFSGHTHCQTSILVSRNIQCTVNDATYMGGIKNQHILFI